MEFIPKVKAQRFENSSSCVVFEYGGDNDISGAVAVINGRYPESGWGMNQHVKEMVYVIKGTGTLTAKEATFALREGDMALIDANEPYFFEGSELHIFMPTTPAWTPEQFINLES